jgi:hypothetical protein
MLRTFLVGNRVRVTGVRALPPSDAKYTVMGATEQGCTKRIGRPQTGDCCTLLEDVGQLPADAPTLQKLFPPDPDDCCKPCKHACVYGKVVQIGRTGGGPLRVWNFYFWMHTQANVRYSLYACRWIWSFETGTLLQSKYGELESKKKKSCVPETDHIALR